MGSWYIKDVEGELTLGEGVTCAGKGLAGQRDPAASRRLFVLAVFPDPVKLVAATARVWGWLGYIEGAAAF